MNDLYDAEMMPATTDAVFADEPITEDELAELAMAADPDGALAADAVPIARYLGPVPLMLPQWYMPPAVSQTRTHWKTALVIAIVVAFVLIDAFGLCSTYGSITLA